MPTLTSTSLLPLLTDWRGSWVARRTTTCAAGRRSLVRDDFTVVVSPGAPALSLSRNVPIRTHPPFTLQPLNHTDKWMAPECFVKNNFSEATDVWWVSVVHQCCFLPSPLCYPFVVSLSFAYIPQHTPYIQGVWRAAVGSVLAGADAVRGAAQHGRD